MIPWGNTPMLLAGQAFYLLRCKTILTVNLTFWTKKENTFINPYNISRKIWIKPIVLLLPSKRVICVDLLFKEN